MNKVIQQMKPLTFLLISLVLSTTACKPVQTRIGGGDLTNSKWRLVSFGKAEAETAVIEGSTITLELDEKGQVGGSSGCNSYGGTYTVQDDTLTIEDIASTLMACADQAVNDQEAQYLRAIGSVGRYSVTDKNLTIWYNNENGMLNFERAATSVAQPTGTSLPGEIGERIRFPEGDTSIEIFAELTAGASDSYVLGAQQGQILLVEINSPNKDVLLSVTAENGELLKHAQDGPPSWTSQLTVTQDYFLQAVSVGTDTSYTLHVWLESDPSARVEIGAGTTSARYSGALPAGGTKEYVLAAAAGQTMQVETVGYNAPVEFTLTTPTGETWPSEPHASEV